MKKLKLRIHAAIALFLLSHSATYATESPSNSVTSAFHEEIKWLREETYVTTATKTLEDINKSGATVSVITADDLKKMGARNLNDALKRVPGLGINQFNIGMPAVEVRGVKTDFGEKVLFLINGHPSNTNVVNGGSTWVYENFIVDEIERVEIIRGTGSALYGADAFVATINIITKTANDINGSIITLGKGSYKTEKINVQSGQIFNDLKIAINANFTDTNGFEGEVKADALGNSGKLDSWVRRHDLAFNLEYEHYSLQGKYVDRSAGAYAGVANALNTVTEQNYIQYFIELGYSRELTSTMNIASKLYLDHFGADNLWQFFPESADFPEGVLGRTPGKTDRVGIEVQTELTLGKAHKLLVGFMTEHQKLYDVKFFNNYDPFTGAPTGVYEDVSDKWNWNGDNDRKIHALFVQQIWDATEALRFIVGGRYDHYSDFGGTFNPRTSITWGFINNYNLIATYGTAFRAPSFGELYNKNNPSVVGNPDVEPEIIETYELAIHGNLSKRMGFKLTGFRSNIHDLIAPTPTASSVNQSGNVGELKVDGVEFELDSRFVGGSKIAFNYTYQNPRNELDEQVANVPRHKLNLSFDYRHSRFAGIYAGLNHRGQLSRSPGDSRSDVPSYATLDIAFNCNDKTDHWNATASIYNFFDKNYADASPNGVMDSDYPKPGRSFMLEVSYKL